MIVLPLIFFSIWTIISYKKYGISIGTYILSLYTFSSICSILIDSFNLYNITTPKIEVGIIAPLIYIATIYLCIKPIYSIGIIKFKTHSIRIEKILKFLSIFYLVVFIIVFIVSYQRIIVVLGSDSLANIRNEQYTGDAVSFYNHLSGFKRYVCAVLSIISPSSFGMLLVFGYLMAFSKCSFIYKLSAFIGSLTQLIIAITIADRSNYFYWIVLLGFSLILFFRYFPRNSKIITIIILSLALLVILSYFFAVTNSRFEDRDGGSTGGLILYAGQSFYNFCRFVNTLDPPNTLNIIFPNITKYIFDGDSYFELAHKIEIQQHTILCVFPTFIGIIYSVSGLFVTIFFLLVYCSYANHIKRIIKNIEVSISNIFLFWCIAIIPAIGVITYFYLNSGGTTALIIWLLISHILKK